MILTNMRDSTVKKNKFTIQFRNVPKAKHIIIKQNPIVLCKVTKPVKPGAFEKE